MEAAFREHLVHHGSRILGALFGWAVEHVAVQLSDDNATGLDGWHRAASRQSTTMTGRLNR